jgi:hypothetical protein
MSSEDQKPKDPMSREIDLGPDWGEDFQFEEIEIEEDLEDLASIGDGDILLDGLDEDLDEWEEYIDSHWIDIM